VRGVGDPPTPLSVSETGISSGEPAMRYSSFAHAPKSISLHRSEQNGRKAFSGENTAEPLHCGHFTLGALRASLAFLLESFMGRQSVAQVYGLMSGARSFRDRASQALYLQALQIAVREVEANVLLQHLGSLHAARDHEANVQRVFIGADLWDARQFARQCES
jgi:hypothetical protein